MDRAGRRRFSLSAVVIPIAFAGALIWYTMARVQHERLNRALMEAAFHGDTRAVRALLDQGADVNARAPFPSAASDFLSVLRSLLHAKPDNRKALTALQAAGSFDVMQILVEHGATGLNAHVNYDHRTLLMAAIRERHIGLVRALLDRGVDVNARDWIETTALMDAASVGRIDMVEALLAHGAAINARDQVGRTALLHACVHGHRFSEVARLLLAHGANVNLSQQGTFTPLKAAVDEGNVETVRLLIAYGAAAHPNDPRTQRALTLAEVWENRPIIALLKRAGIKETSTPAQVARIRETDRQQRTAVAQRLAAFRAQRMRPRNSPRAASGASPVPAAAR